MPALMLERLVNHLLRSTMQPRTEQTDCAICFEEFSDVLAATAVCSNDHHVCEPCMYRWAHREVSIGNTPTCPVCREPAIGWQNIQVLKLLSGGGIQVAVRREYNVFKLKESIRWTCALPVGCIRLVRKEYDTNHSLIRTVQLTDTDGINNVGAHHNALCMVLRCTMASYTLMLDIPRCASAPDECKCYISGGLLLHPVRGTDGKLYERAAIDMWVAQRGDHSPCDNGRLLPLTPITDPAFLDRVNSFPYDAPRALLDDSTAITVNIVCPLNDTRRLTVQLGDTLLQVVQQVNPRQERLITEDGVLFNTLHFNTTLNRCRINDNDTLYFPA